MVPWQVGCFLFVFSCGQAHIGQIDKWPWHYTTPCPNNSLELWTEKIHPMVSGTWRVFHKVCNQLPTWSGTTINLQSEGLGGKTIIWLSLQWRHNGPDSVSNHQPHYCLLNRLFGPRSKKTSKLRVTGLCAWNSPGTGEFPAQMASYAENVSIWWRHHGAVQRVKVVEWWQCQNLGQLIMP